MCDVRRHRPNLRGTSHTSSALAQESLFGSLLSLRQPPRPRTSSRPYVTGSRTANIRWNPRTCRCCHSRPSVGTGGVARTSIPWSPQPESRSHGGEARGQHTKQGQQVEPYSNRSLKIACEAVLPTHDIMHSTWSQRTNGPSVGQPIFPVISSISGLHPQPGVRAWRGHPGHGPQASARAAVQGHRRRGHPGGWCAPKLDSGTVAGPKRKWKARMSLPGGATCKMGR